MTGSDEFRKKLLFLLRLFRSELLYISPWLAKLFASERRACPLRIRPVIEVFNCNSLPVFKTYKWFKLKGKLIPLSRFRAKKINYAKFTNTIYLSFELNQISYRRNPYVRVIWWRIKFERLSPKHTSYGSLTMYLWRKCGIIERQFMSIKTTKLYIFDNQRAIRIFTLILMKRWMESQAFHFSTENSLYLRWREGVYANTLQIQEPTAVAITPLQTKTVLRHQSMGTFRWNASRRAWAEIVKLPASR